MTQEELFDKYHAKILNYINMKVSNITVAEDLTSTVFLKVCQKFDSYDQSKAAISTWIYTIANNTVIDYYRTAKVYSEIPEDVSTSDSIEDELLNEETLEELANALEKLEERERDIIILHYYSGMTLKEVALKMGMSYSNTKLWHNKALASLKKKMIIE